MEISGFWPIFGVGMFGGILVELLRWWKVRESSGRPNYFKDPFYWVITILMILAGGSVAALYGLGPRNAIMVANLGASTPALIAVLAALPRDRTAGDGSSTGDPLRGPSVQQPTEPARTAVRRFLSFRP